MSFWTALNDPLQGKTSLAKVVWVYGLLGSLLLSALGLFVDPGNAFAMRVYMVFGLVYSAYVTVATYRCAPNCQSRLLASFVRVSTVISVLVIVPIFAYLYFTGALNLAVTLMEGEQ